MTKFKIIWRSYSSDFPDIIAENKFYFLKSSNNKNNFTIKFGYFNEFYGSIFIILLGMAFLLSDYYNTFIRGGLVETMEVIFVFTGAYQLLFLILSSVSYINNYLDSKQYLRTLEKTIKKSESYIEFCNEMSKSDSRYIMHIQRLSDNKNSN